MNAAASEHLVFQQLSTYLLQVLSSRYLDTVPASLRVPTYRLYPRTTNKVSFQPQRREEDFNMWRGNSHNNNNTNHRAWRPSAGGSRRLESTAPARSTNNTQRSTLPSATGTNLNARHSATAQVQNGLTSQANTHARQSLTTPGHNGLSGNSREDWGLMGDSRPPTPSEGRAQVRTHAILHSEEQEY